MGVPNDHDFQLRVMTAALDLLNRQTGPVLEAYPEDVYQDGEVSPPACPVSFSNQGKSLSWQQRLIQELAELRPWYEIGLKRRSGRTLVGACQSPIEEIMTRLGAYLDADQLTTDDLSWFKLAMEDAKAFYVEAITAQPGDYAIDAIYSTLWNETAFGSGLKELHEQFSAHPKLSGFGRILLPRSAMAQRRF